MTKVDLSFRLTDLNGQELEINGFSNGTAGQLISTLLIDEIKGDAIKLYDWAMKLNKNDLLEMDDSDFIKFKNLITDSSKLTVLPKAQILKYLEKLK